MEFSNRRLSAHSQSRYAWQFGSDPHTVDVPLKNPTRFDDWIPNETRFNDGALITIAPGRYEPMRGAFSICTATAAEFTRSAYAAYLYDAGDEARKLKTGGGKVVRGGSWRDIPARCTSSFRLSYLPWQRVYIMWVSASSPKARNRCSHERTA